MKDQRAEIDEILAYAAPEVMSSKLVLAGYYRPYVIESVDELAKLSVHAIILVDGYPCYSDPASSEVGDETYEWEQWYDHEGCVVADEYLVGGLVIFDGSADV